jgi:hypothetical protein
MTRRALLIVVVAAAGGVLTALPASAKYPGTNGQIAFTRFDPVAQTTHIFVADPSGANQRQLPPDDADGAFTGGCCGISGAWVVRTDGTGLRAISTPIAAGRFRTPVWSPDSSKLLLNRLDRAGNASLWVADADGSSLRKLADTASPSLYAWGTAPGQG